MITMEISCTNVNSNLSRLILIFYRSLKLKRYENYVGLPATQKLNLQYEYSDDYRGAEETHPRKGGIVITRKLNNVFQEQNLIGNFKNDFHIFILKTHCMLYKNKCSSLVQMNTSIWNQNCIRYYSAQAKKKNSNDDLLTCKKDQGCSFNKSKKQETVAFPVQQEKQTQKPEAKKIPDSKAICTKKTCTKGTCQNKQTPSKQDTLNILTKSYQAQKELRSKPDVIINPIKVNGKGNEVKLDDAQKEKKLHHQAKCKICKPVPPFRIHRFREPPTWKVWLYSFLGITLKKSKIGLSILKCCKIVSSENVTWVKLNEYPKPVLEPSRKHLSKGSSKEKFIKPNNTKVYNKITPCKKEPSKTSLQKDTKTKEHQKDTKTKEQQQKDKTTKEQQKDTRTKEQQQKDKTTKEQQKDTTAKWAIQGSDKKVTGTEDKTIGQIKKCEKKSQTEKPTAPSTEETSSRVNSIHDAASDFCKTLVDLCSGKTTSSCNLRKQEGVQQQSFDKIKPKGNNIHLINSVPSNKTKHDCDKKVDTKKVIQPIPQKRNSNSLETTEEFRRKKYETPKMPEHYTGGAGEIERKLMEKQKTFPYKVRFRYRDHCKRKPNERIPGVHK